jgi:ADP-ribosylglycohydrolase
MSAASPLNVIATSRNAGINLAIANEKLICRITHRSARSLMASVDFEGNPMGKTVPDGEAMKTQLYLERITADTEELEEEQKTNLDQVYNHKPFENGVGVFPI